MEARTGVQPPGLRARLGERTVVSPQLFARIALVALIALTAIVATGAGVRLTGSGLGCPDWPKCFGKAIAPLQTHAVIEYGNRILSGLVGISAVVAAVAAFRRRPYRRDLARLAVLLPVGVAAQGVLGGFTVRHHLAPGFVMAHFGLSMIILVAAVALAWKAAHERGERPRRDDARLVWAVRGLLPLGALTIFVGTAATAAGPHAGGFGSQRIHRLKLEGHGTLNWMIHRHGVAATLLGLGAVVVAALVWRRTGDRQLRRASLAVVGLLALQGVVGGIQYHFHLPTEIVWVHVVLATLTWLAILWSVAAAGRLRSPTSRAAPAA